MLLDISMSLLYSGWFGQGFALRLTDASQDPHVACCGFRLRLRVVRDLHVFDQHDDGFAQLH